MIRLTEEQSKAVVTTALPEVLDPASQEIYVLVSKQAYERLTELAYDASPWTDEEMDLLAAEDADSLGWDGMEVYQEQDQ